MVGASISVGYDTGRAVDFFRHLGEHIEDFSPLFRDIGEYLGQAHDAVLKDTLAVNESPHELEFGTKRTYGATHQFGRGPSPARPFVGVSDEDEGEILRVLRD